MKIFDLHNDCLTGCKNYVKYLNKNSNHFISTAIYKGDLSFNDALKIADYIKHFKNAKVCFEDVSYNGLKIDEIISLSPLYVSLTYNGENEFGYGVDYDLPLKPKGVEFSKYLSKKGVVIDTAHLSKRGVYTLLDNGCKIINSHTCLNSVYNHKRNITDNVAKNILQNKGLIGLTLVGYFLCEKNATIFDYFKHVDYFLQKFGDDGICIGTDFNGTDYLPKNLTKYRHFSCLKNILIKYGYNNDTICKLFYKNAESFFNV